MRMKTRCTRPFWENNMIEANSKIEKLKEIIRDRGLVTRDKQKIIGPRGEELDWLFDLRNIFLKPDSLNLVVDIFWEKFEKEYPFQIGGQEIAAIPLVSAIVLRSRQIGKPVNGFIIRKSRKSTGLQKIIEGEMKEGKIILVDDLINSGRTVLRQTKVIESFGKKVHSVFALIDFRTEKIPELFRKKSIEFVSLFSPGDFGLSPGKTESPSENFEIAWNFQAPEPSYFWVMPKSAPRLDGEKIYFGSDNGTFWALNQTDGSVAWTFRTGYGVRGKTIFSSPTICGNAVYFGSYDGNVYALEKETGKLIWKNGDADWVGSSPAVAPDLDLLFIGLEFGLFRKKGGIAAFDLETGKKIWDFRMAEYVHCSPAYCPEKKVVAIGGNDHCAYMFKAKNGKLLWKYKTGGEIKASFAFDAERNLVLFGSFDNSLYALDIDTGELKGKFETKDYIYSTPLVREKDVFFASTDKNLYCANLDTGKLNWQFVAGGRIFASPEIVGEKILFGATDGRLYEIDINNGKCVSFFQAAERITNKISFNSATKKYFLSTYANEIFCLEKRGCRHT